MDVFMHLIILAILAKSKNNVPQRTKNQENNKNFPSVFFYSNFSVLEWELVLMYC